MSGTIVSTTSDRSFPPKIVSWETVRNIANQLTNQLLDCCPEANLGHAHLSSFSNGPRRQFMLEPDKHARWLAADGHNGWHAFEEADVRCLYWESASSGNSLEATKESSGKWLLHYSPSLDMPEHRGSYFSMYQSPEKIENITRS